MSTMAGVDDLSPPPPARPGIVSRMMFARLQERLFERADPVEIGRFRILERIGEGGMSTVWLAHDPQLDRRVAVKQLLPAYRSDAIVREARALARLTHPHVVTVFESGVCDERVFIAMEYLDDGSLADRLRQQPVRGRGDVRRVIELFLAAARGLAAAHDAGLVHRDFKPSNVLLGRDGRIKVADFGLARAADAHLTDPDEPRPLDTGEGESSSVAGGGTPAYMAPEQFDGPGDVRSDQFSFCVALYEALFGTRPFASVSTELSEATDRPRAPRGVVPKWVGHALLRGLAVEPSCRWPDMHALASALDIAARTSRRRRAALAAGGITLVGVLAWRPWANDVDPCAPRGDELVTAWTPDRHAEIEDAFAAVGTALASETWARIDPQLVDYASRWERARATTCEERMVTRTRSIAAYETSMHCLDRRRDELGAITSRLARADASLMPHALDAVETLVPPEFCAESERNGNVLDPDQRATTEELHRALAAVNADVRLGRGAAAQEGIDAVASRIERTGDAGLLAALRLAQARAASMRIEHASAESHYRDALVHAARAGDDALSAAIWPLLVISIAERGEPRRALELELPALTAVARVHDESQRAFDLRWALGTAYVNAERLDRAETEFTTALQLARDRGDPRGRSSDALQGLAHVNLRRGDLERALSLQTEALAVAVAARGRHHPSVASLRNNSAQLLQRLGRHADAVAEYEEGIEVLEAAYGRDSMKVVTALVGIAPALAEVGRAEEGIAALERVLPMLEREGPTRRYAFALSILGTLTWNDSDRALDAFDRAAAVHEQLPELDARGLATNLASASTLRMRRGELEVARDGLHRALELVERVEGFDHPDVGLILVQLAQLHAQEGDHQLAHALAARADAVQRDGSTRPAHVAAARFEHARRRWEAGLRDARSLELMAQAEERARQAKDHELLAEIAAWRAAHPR